MIMSEGEKEVRAIVEKYGIRVNRAEMGKERHKSYNKCKDNDAAFITYKKGSLFPRKGYVEPYEIALERQEMIEDVERRIKQIDEGKMYRKEVYDYAYKNYVSPRMTNLSPNSSFMSIQNKHNSSIDVGNDNNSPKGMKQASPSPYLSINNYQNK